MRTRKRTAAPRLTSASQRLAALVVCGGLALVGCGPPAIDAPASNAREQDPATAVESGARTQPGTDMGLYSPEQHDLYDGRFNIRGARIYQAGSLADESPWDHMGDDASNLRPVGGVVEFEVNEIDNTGIFVADLELPEGGYRVELTEFVEFSPCQDGGIAAFLFEHGDAGCGDANWPKSLLYVAGWGLGRAWLNDELLYEDYQVHFMVTQGMRHRDTLVAATGAGNSETGAGAVNPAAMQLDFYIRSPEPNPANHPGREVFDHFFAMEVTWR